MYKKELWDSEEISALVDKYGCSYSATSLLRQSDEKRLSKSAYNIVRQDWDRVQE
jgi:hypothetical protein